MQYDEETFDRACPAIKDGDYHSYRFCTFESLVLEGCVIDSTFVDCTMQDCDIYLSMFYGADFVGMKFKDCWFRGGSFRDCRFVECAFERCHFVNDNMGGSCLFENNRWYACTQSGCEGLPADFAHPTPGAEAL